MISFSAGPLPAPREFLASQSPWQTTSVENVHSINFSVPYIFKEIVELNHLHNHSGGLGEENEDGFSVYY